MCCEIGDPEGCTNVTRKTYNCVKSSLSNKLPKSGIIQAPKSLLTRTEVAKLDPFKTLEKWNIPLNSCVEFWIVRRFCPAQRTVGNLQFNFRLPSHLTQNWRHVLNWMTAHNEDSQCSVLYHLAKLRSELYFEATEHGREACSSVCCRSSV